MVNTYYYKLHCHIWLGFEGNTYYILQLPNLIMNQNYKIIYIPLIVRLYFTQTIHDFETQVNVSISRNVIIGLVIVSVKIWSSSCLKVKYVYVTLYESSDSIKAVCSQNTSYKTENNYNRLEIQSANSL